MGVAAETTRTALTRVSPVAGATPADIDVVQLYDAFTINTILFLEDLGFCPKGEGGNFVSGGAIGPGGVLPVNTNGGGLSCTHPGMYGIFALIEAVRRQVDTLQTVDALWQLHDFLSIQRHVIEGRFDFRLDGILFVFASLVKEGLLQLDELQGLDADKLGKVSAMARF
jgi:hypothetical protein